MKMTGWIIPGWRSPGTLLAEQVANARHPLNEVETMQQIKIRHCVR